MKCRTHSSQLLPHTLPLGNRLLLTLASLTSPQTNPEGPSFTTTVCPKYTQLTEFSNNTAHSNMFYGLRVHPEFLPVTNPCAYDYDSTAVNYGNLGGAQVSATFQYLTAYKNGMKGAIMTQASA